MLLDGRVAMVTGTGPNIGGEIARTLAANGAKVVCLDLLLEHAQTAAQQIVERGGSATAVNVDITNPADVQKAVETAVSTFGGLHILVNNAAISIGGDLLQVKLEDWHRVLDVILTGTLLCSRYAAKQMIAQGSGGAIVNIASTSGHRGGMHNIAYNTAKAGTLNLTRCMALTLAPHKIRVNSVTPTTTGVSLSRGAERSGTPRNIPLGRYGRPIDQAKAVLFLVSSEAEWITGADLPVDGGVLAILPAG
ncbi:MAG: glucose 1-dehydrogenase [Chloroflexi bacterium]|nr:glucose 1-dehydrogenase [Chloroflexota bacterium]